jgi:hypothetical protein
MPIWTENGEEFVVNMFDNNIARLKNKGCKFCWMSDNPGIKDENNTTFYETKTIPNAGTEEGTGKQCLKDDISVRCVGGNQVTGYIIHWVRGPCAASDEKDWFIIKPGKRD